MASCVCVLGLDLDRFALAETQTVDVYAINDFHGAVDKMPRVAGYLAARKAEGAIILNSGDMFQGSMESNSNYGKLLTDCMKEAGVDEMTYGNHEFDWGLDNLRNLAENSGIPFLGANIYNWNPDTRSWGGFADDLADKYIIKEVGNIKVGVIGVIGDDQITSICSQLVQTIGFKDPLPIIKELATELRNEQGCDIVVVSAHDGPQDIVDGSGGTYDEPTTTADLENYVDAVFCAHTHSQQNYLINGLPFLQGKSYGNYVSHVKFCIDNGNVRILSHENISYYSLTNVDQSVQDKVQTLIDNSNARIAEERNEVLANLSGGLTSKEEIPRLVSHAIANYAQYSGYDIDVAIVNEARNPLPAGDITYSTLYEAIPFDNEVYIARISGKDIINEMRYGQSMWRTSERAIKNTNDYYTVAVIDYLLFHQNSKRNYNYFPSAFNNGFEPIPLTKNGVDVYNYRLITRDFLRSINVTVDTTLYTNFSARTDASRLESSVLFDDDPYKWIPVNNGDNGHINGLPDYAIALIVVGAVLIVAAIVVIIVVLCKRKKRVGSNI